MSVPFLNLATLHESIRPELDAAFDRVVHGSSFIGGSEVRAFEEEFAAAHRAPAAAGCASGTDALALALRALGIGPGAEVVVPSMTFVATAEAVLHVGATPVLADVDPTTLLITAASVDAVRTERTRAVIPVHLYGHVVPFDVIDRWRAAGLVVVEDAAQAHLASWHDERVGSHGDAACFSFYPGKNLGALGDGGCVVSHAPAVVAEVARLRNHGRTAKYEHDVVGWCSRLDGLQAAFLRVKLTHLAAWTAARREVAEIYARHVPDGLLVPWEPGAVHHLLVARLDDRDRIAAGLADAGIGTGIHYPITLAQQPALARWARETPNADRAAETVLSLPMDPFLTESDVDLVVGALVRAVEGAVA